MLKFGSYINRLVGKKLIVDLGRLSFTAMNFLVSLNLVSKMIHNIVPNKELETQKIKLDNGDYVEIDDRNYQLLKIILHKKITTPNGEDDYNIDYEPEIIYPKL